MCVGLHVKYRLFFIHSFIPLACAEFDNSLPFSEASSLPLCYVIFPATLLHQLFFHPPSLHLAIYFLVYLSILLFPNYIYNTLFEILFSSILCTCPNQRNLFNFLLLLQSALQPLVGFRPAQLSLSILSRKVLQGTVANGTSNPQLGGEPGI
jgi:hypothetical protein